LLFYDQHWWCHVVQGVGLVHVYWLGHVLYSAIGLNATNAAIPDIAYGCWPYRCCHPVIEKMKAAAMAFLL
jgi:hypothetical protein